MNNFDQKGKVVVTCKDRFAPYLEQELIALGFKPLNVDRTSIELHATMNECIFLNMHLRVASHVLFEIKTFYLHHARDIYRRVKNIAWEDYIDNDTYFSVVSHVENESVNNPLIVNVKVKDAIVDRFRDHTGQRPDSGAEFDGAVFQLFWKEKQASLFINTSGDTLSKRGYRKLPWKAPMVENLAAATIMASNWDTKEPFINPMCGAGTLVIEAALMATNRYPGLFREHYSFMHIKGYNPSIYQQLQQQLQSKVNDNISTKFVASDISERALQAAKENASVANVIDHISFEEVDFAATTVPDQEQGVVFFNPEYGERLGEEEELVTTYQRMGDFMKQHCQGYTGFIFTGNPQLGKRVGLRPSRKIAFYNGTIDCRLLRYELYSGGKKDR
ncbi:class I SAM-dependent RNA methyltransferase [Echinicola strongylocentroti]|uniref:Class I SAM-dependent RNA methyltransferase n=1 Tax=Echinicola strongylocentroti TaxID=1795355 RepID=A0A2Z4IE23_9BACT|nr:class I SAM-dependent RNA methyltransferase [Echinicola strongylocentroti]AWW28738.1 class I SAM-dependent RNA methyltransferase [Echinicola strongylocentroti]